MKKVYMHAMLLFVESIPNKPETPTKIYHSWHSWSALSKCDKSLFYHNSSLFMLLQGLQHNPHNYMIAWPVDYRVHDQTELLLRPPVPSDKWDWKFTCPGWNDTCLRDCICYHVPDYRPVLSDKCHNDTTCPRRNFSKFLPVRDGWTKLKVEPCQRVC